jgi:3'(2'), 5'-bisphosphate nucleotidase
MSLQREREVAIAAVLLACRLCEAVRSSFEPANAITKEDHSPVTVADFGAQAVISHALHVAFPADPLVAEEETSDLQTPERAPLRAAVVAQVTRILPHLDEAAVLAAIAGGGYTGGRQGRFWTLDPVDGTKGFLRGGQYAIALALIEQGEVILSVLGCPNLPRTAAVPDSPRGCLFIAMREQGAAMRGLDDPAEQAIRVDAIADPTQAIFCESVEAAHSSHAGAARIAARLGVIAPPVRMDSQCKYAVLARGDASIYLRLPTNPAYREKIWDHAAGALLIDEAGGTVTDLNGNPLDFGQGRTFAPNTGIVATNGRLHTQVLHAVEK